MEPQTELILNQNITLVYDSLDLQAIDTSQLKQLMEAQPLVMDTPEVIVAIYPPEPTIVQMDGKRVRVTLQEQSDVLGKKPIWDVAIGCHDLVQNSLDSSLIAYGFNYDVGFRLGEDSSPAIMNLFLADRSIIERTIEAELTSFVPRLRFERDRTAYDLVLEPLEKERLKAHLNSHFEYAGLDLPDPQKLEESFASEFEQFVSLVKALLTRSV